MHHILVPDNVDKQAIQLLEAHHAFSVNAPGRISKDELMQAVAGAHALIIRSGVKVTADVLAGAPNLKAVARAGVGVDNVDLDAATEHGVIVMNTPEGNTISTAEYTFGLILALSRNIPQGYKSLSEGRWDRKAYMGVELRQKTLGIVGLGRVGREVARRALAFDMSVLAYDPRLEVGHAPIEGVQAVELDTLLAGSDFISLHSILTDDTREMIRADTIIKMKPGVRLINTARGALINDHDLATAIEHGHIAGAAVDVYEKEPPPDDHPLVGLKNVIHTPHLAASTSDAQVKVGIDAAQQIIDGLSEGNFRNVVNPAVLERT
jgi:D-3-phosphoglycerate dehydrogenase